MKRGHPVQRGYDHEGKLISDEIGPTPAPGHRSTHQPQHEQTLHEQFMRNIATVPEGPLKTIILSQRFQDRADALQGQEADAYEPTRHDNAQSNEQQPYKHFQPK